MRTVPIRVRAAAAVLAGITVLASGCAAGGDQAATSDSSGLVLRVGIQNSGNSASVETLALLADLIKRHRPVVLLVTHDVEEALRLASRVLVLGDGTISFDAPVPDDDRARVRLRSDLLAELGVEEAPL